MADIYLSKSETLKVLKRLLLDITKHSNEIYIQVKEGYQYEVGEYSVYVHPSGDSITVFYGVDQTTIYSDNRANRPLIMEILGVLIKNVERVETKRKKDFLVGLGL